MHRIVTVVTTTASAKPIVSMVGTARFAQLIGSAIFYPMLAVSGMFVPLTDQLKVGIHAGYVAATTKEAADDFFPGTPAQLVWSSRSSSSCARSFSTSSAGGGLASLPCGPTRLERRIVDRADAVSAVGVARTAR